MSSMSRNTRETKPRTHHRLERANSLTSNLLLAALLATVILSAGCAGTTQSESVTAPSTQAVASPAPTTAPAPAVSPSERPALRLASPFSDSMVLQRDRPAPIWGWAAPGETITIEFHGKTVTATADASGAWKTSLGPFGTNNAPETLSVTGNAADRAIALRDILVGDVWVCSGQSNMEMAVEGWGKVINYEKEVAGATDTQIRLLTIPHRLSPVVETTVENKGWQVCSPESVANFSAAAYFFARDLRKRQDVPIGLIQSAWGGTPAEVWTPIEDLEKLSFMAPVLKQFGPLAAKSLEAAKALYVAKLNEWNAQLDTLDAGKPQGDNAPWAAPEFDDDAWKTMNLPGVWEDQGLPDFDGTVWYRREVEIPAAWAGKKLRLDIGPVDDGEWTWFNGALVGSNAEYGIFRKYDIAPELVKPGRAVVTIRVQDNTGGGGLFGKPGDLKLVLASDEANAPISLAGSWRYAIGLNMRDMPPLPPDPDSRYPRWPSCLYNGMIAPIVPTAIAGVIWYQGESNANRAYEYRALFPAMIRAWREKWGQGDFPFLFVQIANFMAPPTEPEDSAWAELREAQTMTLSLPKTAMAVAIDIGDEKDIHPKNKQDVGYRLALGARAVAYGERVEYSGPIYRDGSMKIEGNEIRVSFLHVFGGLKAKGNDGKLVGFSIAGEDRKFVWADARIDGNTVVVSSPQVPNPVAVRYAWANNPPCNLYNGEDLPASPFRTDDWPGLTAPKK